MSTRSLLTQVKMKEWSSVLAAQRASGLSVTKWCQVNNYNKDKFFYWKRKLKDEAVTEMFHEIVPLNMESIPSVPTTELTIPTDPTKNCKSCTTFTQTPCARIYINGVTIEIDSSASDSFITTLIRAVRNV